VVAVDFSLELLRGPAVPACCADWRGSLNSRPAVPAAMAAAVVANQVADILQVAPLLAGAVGRFAVSVGPAKFVNKDLAVALAETIFNGQSCWGPDPDIKGLSDGPSNQHGPNQVQPQHFA